MKVALTGASGYTGGRLPGGAPDARGDEVSALVRPAVRDRSRSGRSGARIVEGDLSDARPVGGWSKGADAVAPRGGGLPDGRASRLATTAR